jgi:hypothetical protein
VPHCHDVYTAVIRLFTKPSIFTLPWIFRQAEKYLDSNLLVKSVLFRTLEHDAYIAYKA